MPDEMQPDEMAQYNAMTPEQQDNYKQQQAIKRAIQGLGAKPFDPNTVAPQPVAPTTVPAQPADEQTMQQNPGNLMDVLKRKREQDTLKNLFNPGK